MDTVAHKDLVLITRPRQQGEDFACALRAYGIDTLCAPVLEYHALEKSLPDLGKYDGLIFTSINGLYLFNNHNNIPDIPVFAVGNKTAEKARSLGFKDVYNAQGNADDLARTIDRALTNTPAKLLHICGTHNKKVPVQNKDIQIEQYKTYRMDKIHTLPPQTIHAMRTGSINYATFFSPRSAKNFINLIEQHNLTSCLININALCISDSVLKCVQDMKWKTVAAARHPTRTAMIEMITGKKSS